MYGIDAVQQSIRAIDLADGLQLTVFTRDPVNYAGRTCSRTNYTTDRDYLINKRCVYDPQVWQDNLKRQHSRETCCLIVATVVALHYKCINNRKRKTFRFIPSMMNTLTILERYCDLTGKTSGDMSHYTLLGEILYKKYRRQLYIFEYASEIKLNIVYQSKPYFTACLPVISLLLCNNHMYFITNVSKMGTNIRICATCGSIKNGRYCGKRTCTVTNCRRCDTKDCSVSKNILYIHCKNCNIYFKTDLCYENHLKNLMCMKFKRCDACTKIFNTDESHLCGQHYCKDCRKIVITLNHICYLQPPSKRNNDFVKTLYFDSETYTDSQRRIRPILAIIKIVCPLCEQLEGDQITKTVCCGERYRYFRGVCAIKEVCDFVFYKNLFRNCLLMAHGFGCFDSQLIFEELLKRGANIKLFTKGLKIIDLKCNQVTCRDSLQYFECSLDAAARAFGVAPTSKSFFPHKINSIPFYHSVLPSLPDRIHFEPDLMNAERRKSFEEWYEENKDKRYNVQHELELYCKQDTHLLSLICLKFKQFIKTTTNTNIFSCSLTIAGLCIYVYKKLYMPPPDEDGEPSIQMIGDRNIVSDTVTANSHIALQTLSYIKSKIIAKGQVLNSAENGHEVVICSAPVDGLIDNTHVIQVTNSFHY